jgi:hypothetical protein
VQDSRGILPKDYALSEKGSRLLAIFDKEEKEDAVIRGTRHN